MRRNRRAGDSTRIVVEPDLLRTAVVTFLLGGLAAILAYFAICAAAGEGRRVFQVIGTLTILLALGAAVNNERRWLRTLLFLWALGIGALLVDQLVYFHWHRRVDRFVAGLQASAATGSSVLSGSLPLRPTAIQIDRDREVVLTFEPPLLAWTYRADAASPVAHTLIAGWYGALEHLVQQGSPDRVARTIVTPHQAYAVRVVPGETLDGRRAPNGESWVISVDSARGGRSL